MMTTSSTYGINQRISDPLMGPQIENPPAPPAPVPAAAPKTKEQLLQEAVEKYSKGEISKEQFETISKALTPPVVEVKQKVVKPVAAPAVVTEPEKK